MPGPGEGPAAARRVKLSVLDREGRAVAVELVLWSGGGDTVHAFIYDVSGRRAARHAAAQLAAIVESSLAAIFSHDLEGRILRWNRAARLTFGFSAEEALGASVHLIVPPARQGEVERTLESVRRGGRISHHGSVRR